MLRKWMLILLSALFVMNAMAGICETPETTWDVTQKLTRYANGVRNPLKGWRADADLNTRFGTLVRYYVKWNELESSAEDGVEKILDFSNDIWYGANLQNCKVIPRVYLEWPDVGTYWPEDMETGDYTSPAFQERLRALVKKMAAAWDNDPRVAYIEMGLIGLWGEHHSPEPTRAVSLLLIECFEEYFQNTLVMVRYPSSLLFRDGDFGIYWDEWGSNAQWSIWNDRMDSLTMPRYKDRWKTQVMGGENTNNHYTPGTVNISSFLTYGCETGFDAETAFTTYASDMIKYARLVHANHMHTRINEIHSNQAKMNLNVFQDTLGYAFELKEARFNHVDAQERRLQFSFDVTNTGCSPLYYDWPVRVSLLDKKNLKPVWNQLIPDVSVMNWMPGEEWQVDEKKYAIPAPVYTVDASIDLPASVKDGEYILALSIPDPAGLSNAAIFLNTGYISGGYTVLGNIGVGAEPAQDGSLFSKLIPQQDIALRYSQNFALHQKCNVPAVVDGLSSTSWISDGSAIEIEMDKKRALTSITVEFEKEQKPFKVYSPAKDGTWQEVVGEVFQNQTGETYFKLDNLKTNSVRIVSEKDAVLTQIMVYGLY